VMGDLKKVFRPELLNRNRRDHRLPRSSRRPEILQIVDLMLNRLRVQMAEHEVTLELADEAKEDARRRRATTRRWAARPLRRAIQRLIEDPLADYVLGRSLEPGSTIVVARKNEGGGRHHRRPAGTAGGAGNGRRSIVRGGCTCLGRAR